MSGLPSIMQRGYDEAMTAPHTLIMAHIVVQS
jgi:hypothetical protein